MISHDSRFLGYLMGAGYAKDTYTVMFVLKRPSEIEDVPATYTITPASDTSETILWLGEDIYFPVDLPAPFGQVKFYLTLQDVRIAEVEGDGDGDEAGEGEERWDYEYLMEVDGDGPMKGQRKWMTGDQVIEGLR